MAKELKGNTVLIIEDDASARTFACPVLELEGYHVLQAETRDEGLRLVREKKVDLVILDLKLPDDNGWTIMEKIKNDPVLSVIPVIVYTASFGEPQKERTLTLGATDYLIKPLSADSLKKAIGRALRQKR